MDKTTNTTTPTPANHATPLPVSDIAVGLPPLEEKSNTGLIVKILFITAFVLLIVAAVGGYLIYTKQNQSTVLPPQQNIQNNQIVVPSVVTPTVEASESAQPDPEIDGIDIGSDEADFKQLNQDINNL